MINLEFYKKRKKALSMTNQNIADLSGIPKRTVEDFFRGASINPRIDTVQAIEKALGIDGGITSEEYEEGARYTKKVSITADEEDILDKSREVMDEFGAKGKDLIIEFCDLLLNKFKK